MYGLSPHTANQHETNMKLQVVTIAVILAAVVMAEDCPTNNVASECTHVSCSDGYTKVCTNNICTCESNSNAGACASLSDCDTTASCTIDLGIGFPIQGEFHCVDEVCQCTFPGGIGK